MQHWQERTHLLIGADGLKRLQRANILVVGVGGVGAMAAEMLCRAGVGQMTIVDMDTVSETNINRQLVALHSTIGHTKTEELRKRLIDINPALRLTVIADWLDEKNTTTVLSDQSYDFVVDAIDTISPKVHLIKNCIERHIHIVSAMGAGAKLDPTAIKISDISKSYNCPLARMVRKRLSKFGIKRGFSVVFTSELPCEKAIIEQEERYKKSIAGTISYMPALFGIYLSAHVIRELIKE